MFPPLWLCVCGSGACVNRLVLPRKQTWIGMATLQSLVPMVIEKPQLRDIMMLYVAAYVFLLRVPSEGLPMAAHASPEGKEVPIFSIQNSEAVLWFPSARTSYTPRSWCGHVGAVVAH